MRDISNLNLSIFFLSFVIEVESALNQLSTLLLLPAP